MIGAVEPSQGRVPAVVGVAASLGGLRAFRELLSSLPADFPAPIVLVQHLWPDLPSHLADLLACVTPLCVKQAVEGEPLRAGTIFTPVPGRHIVIDGDRLALSDGPKVHYARPSADVLFESMARHFGDRAIAVILTGKGRDGSHGAACIRQRGGFVIAQCQESAIASEMPYSAVLTRKVDLILKPRKIAFALETLLSPEGLSFSA